MSFDFKSAFSDLGGAVSDIFASQGAQDSAAAYGQAAAQAGVEATIAGYSGEAKTALVTRQAYGIIGSQKADVAGAGFTGGGSAGDLERDSTMQANIAIGATKMQGDLQVEEYKSQQQMDLAKQQEAQQQSSGDIFGAIIKGVGLIASFF
jgi:hypothetical protein